MGLKAIPIEQHILDQINLIGEHRTNHTDSYGIFQKLSPIFHTEGKGSKRKFWIVAGIDQQQYYECGENKKKKWGLTETAICQEL